MFFQERITPAGNKSSALPILCASLLTDKDVIIKNFPDLTDVQKLIDLMISMGSKVEWDKREIFLRLTTLNLRTI